VTETTRAAESPDKRPGLLRSSIIYAALTLVSRFLGLARDLVITARLGASQTIAADAYYTALTFPNLFRRMFAEGAFAAAFVPDYSKRLAAEGKESADRFAADALATMAAATIAITIACQLAMPWIMSVYSYGFLEDPEKFKLAVILTQITMPYLPCMVIAALFAGTLQARGRFVIYGLYPSLLNIAMLVAVLPQHDPTAAAYAASWGVLVAGVSQAALLVGRAPHGRPHPSEAPAPHGADTHHVAPDGPGGDRLERHPDQPVHLGDPGQPGGGHAGLAERGRALLPAPLEPGRRGHRRGLAAAAVHLAPEGRPRRHAERHGPGRGLRPGAQPAGGRGADGDAGLPHRRLLHERRLHQRRRGG
jgi:hypothetical protein